MSQIITPEPSNAEKMKEIQAAFEKKFGLDKATRTPEQWRALVENYGIKQVGRTDGLTGKQVRKKMKGL